jgi:hypothetical protein
VLANVVRMLGHLPWRPVPFVLASAAALGWGLASSGRPSAHGDRLVSELASLGLEARPEDVRWVDPPASSIAQSVLRSARVLVRANARAEAHDIYLLRVRTSPEGTVLGIASLYNLTHTTGADEGTPTVDAETAVYTTEVEGVTTNVYALDLAKEPDANFEELRGMARTQARLSNLQQTGQLSGIGRRGWSFDPAPSAVRVSLSKSEIDVVADDRAIRLPREGLEPIEGGAWIRPHRTARARPGNLVTWAVDRVRALSWFGDARMQSIKAFVFTVSDWLERIVKSVERDTSEKDIAKDFGDGAHMRPVTYTDPETGWPPPPMKPYVSPALKGEGEWVALDQDPFVLANPGAPSAFVTSFIRTDRDRHYTRIYVTVWDPRQVQMHMMAGTVEPIGATGEAGPGLIPRTPEVLGRLVAGMNGGFQAMHGEFGMMGDGVVYLPPKPFAATVAELRDGSTAFGEWPREPDIPDDILSYRQNLTALVKDERYNPYARTWWGGTPPDQTDKVHSVRTGVCLTREDFIAYFYGSEIGAEVLAQAMIQARCKFGIHLDMNVGHTGLEFYRVAPAAQLAPLGQRLQSDWEAEGPVPGMDGWRFRGRRMIRGMPLMNFPRYINREARDFFYLTLRHVLPGTDVPGVPEPESHWKARGLPQHGFPYALATATVHPDPSDPTLEVRLVKIDPRVVRAPGTPGVGSDAPTVLSFAGIARARQSRPTLWLGKGAFSISADAPDGAAELFAGLAPGELPSPDAAAVGITDEGGMLVYAETSASGEHAAASLDSLLASIGCTSRMLLPHGLSTAIGGTTGLDGSPPREVEGAKLRLVRGPGPGARSIFEDTPIVGPEVWQPLQMRRIRYFKKPKPATDASAPRVYAPAPPASADRTITTDAAPASSGGRSSVPKEGPAR